MTNVPATGHFPTAQEQLGKLTVSPWNSSVAIVTPRSDGERRDLHCLQVVVVEHGSCQQSPGKWPAILWDHQLGFPYRDIQHMLFG